MSYIFRLRNALGFLSVLSRPGVLTPEDISSTLPLFPAVGLILGAVLTLPLFVHYFIPDVVSPYLAHLPAGTDGQRRIAHPMIWAWLVVCLDIFLTRGLHLDGWADVWDGWGSGAEGDRFWEIIKDSRMGAFGGMAIAVALIGKTVLFAAIIAGGAYGIIVWSMILSRTGVVFCAYRGKSLARPGLARSFLQGADTKALLSALLQTGIYGYLLHLLPGAAAPGVTTLALSPLLCLAGIQALIGFARRQKGLNGDFLGAVIIYSELCVPLGAIILN